MVIIFSFILLVFGITIFLLCQYLIYLIYYMPLFIKREMCAVNIIDQY